MEDVVNNATTDSVSTMKLKTLLCCCKGSYFNIVLFSYSHKPNYTVEQTTIEIRSRIGFNEFIDTYGESDVWEWKIESIDGIPFIVFDLKNLVKEGTKTRVKPTTKEELQEIINQTIEEQGLECDLNFINVSKITDMEELFFDSKFNGNISNWDVSNVTNMKEMFRASKFNGDISKWDVSNVKDMSFMFENCPLEENPPKWY